MYSHTYRFALTIARCKFLRTEYSAVYGSYVSIFTRGIIPWGTLTLPYILLARFARNVIKKVSVLTKAERRIVEDRCLPKKCKMLHTSFMLTLEFDVLA
ncbi:hypothetical protein DPMN_034093 [Dreissena polymorpha]|uniref:Uncharacterized protein n=1 Tax=Dreissena polymorpha TaxID=45954 RepID=A0A9D4RJF4_DREPO|nr:hypothetical protein DPMN_034093 [Dreissena polymorpha]